MKNQIYFRYGAKIPHIDLTVPDLFLSSRIYSLHGAESFLRSYQVCS